MAKAKLRGRRRGRGRGRAAWTSLVRQHRFTKVQDPPTVYTRGKATSSTERRKALWAGKEVLRSVQRSIKMNACVPTHREHPSSALSFQYKYVTVRDGRSPRVAMERDVVVRKKILRRRRRPCPCPAVRGRIRSRSMSCQLAANLAPAEDQRMTMDGRCCKQASGEGR